MNWLQFGRLIHSLYRRGGPLPDLDWIQDQGLLAVKLCQVHALRADFLEREKCEHLAQLYRQNRQLPAGEFMRLLRESAPEALLRSIKSVNDAPLATASVGQVHRARLHGGEQVVIKVLKGDMRAKFTSDVRSLRRLFRFAERVYPPLRRVGDPAAILADVELLTLTELDLRNEVAGQDELRRIRDRSSARFNLSAVRFPKVFRELSNESVLVSEFISGMTIDELLDRGELSYEKLVELFRLHGFYMFCVGLFHGDLHPGNVLLSQGDFFLLDTGYIDRISKQLRDGLFDFFAGLAWYDYGQCISALQGMSQTQLDSAAAARFERDFLSLYSDFKNASVSRVSLTTRMMQTIRLAVRAGMSFDRGMFGIIRSLMYLDGMVLRCNPDAVLMRDMRPLLEEFTAARSPATHLPAELSKIGQA